MEQKREEIVENETSESFRRDCSTATNSESPCLYVSTRSELAGSSTLTNLDTVRHYSLNKVETCVVDPAPSFSCLRNDAGYKGEEEVARNHRYSDAHVVGCSNTKEKINHEDGWRGQNNRINGDEFVSNNRSRSTNVTESPSSIILDNEPTGEIPAHVMECPSNSTSYNRPVEGRFSSSFSNFFFARSRSTISKSVPREKPIESDKMVQHKTYKRLRLHNENVQEYLGGDASDTVMNRSSAGCSHDIVREGFESPHCGINLREWLESEGVNASKNEKMLLFRQIVERVDVAHKLGIAMLELRPSSFILSDTGDVKYIGSEIELWSLNVNNTRKRELEPQISSHENFRAKIQNLGAYTGNSWLTSQNAQLEKKWYDFPEGYKMGDLRSLNIYSLGLLLFEFLCHFESVEAHSAAMLDLHHRILPPFFLCKNPKEAGFCFWLLHPEPSCRPTIGEILDSDLISEPDIASQNSNEASCVDTVDNAESNLLLDFLDTLKEEKQNKASNLLESMKFLDSDIKMVESEQASRRSSEAIDGGYDYNLKDHVQSPYSSTSRINMLRDKLLGNMSELENAYFSVRSNQLAEMPDTTRSDTDVLRKRDLLSGFGTRHKLSTTEEKSIDRVGTFFNSVRKFSRYNKFEVCGTLRNRDILNTNNVICSLCFDREEEYIAAAGVSKKIKIFQLRSLLNDYVDIQYPILEMSNKSKLSCICWNNYMESYLASTDYDGLVQIWDARTGQGFGQYNEHQKRAWSVDFSRVDPRKFASGGDDCSLKLWSINERSSTETIWNPANVCCVQFSSYSSHLLAFGSADYKIYVYDLRHTRIPWCTLSGHENAVSYIRFLDSETLVSASTDNTLKLWDLKKTSLDGLSPDACSLTFRGHTNEKNFVGLAVLDGYIACGSETNEVYAYYKSLAMPITSHKFGCTEPGDEDDHFVSSVCWRRKSRMIAVANSSGTIKILRMKNLSPVCRVLRGLCMLRGICTAKNILSRLNKSRVGQLFQMNIIYLHVAITSFKLAYRLFALNRNGSMINYITLGRTLFLYSGATLMIAVVYV